MTIRLRIVLVVALTTAVLVATRGATFAASLLGTDERAAVAHGRTGPDHESLFDTRASTKRARSTT